MKMLTCSVEDAAHICNSAQNPAVSEPSSSSLPALKRQKIEPQQKQKKKGEVDLDDDGWETDVNDYEADLSPRITWRHGEEKANLVSFYNKARQSKGFDVECPVPSGYDWAEPIPLRDDPNYDPKYERNIQRMNDCAYCAVNEYNTRKGKLLVLDKVCKGNMYFSFWGRKYYITLKAKDPTSNLAITYQTRVLFNHDDEKIVEVFRRKPE